MNDKNLTTKERMALNREALPVIDNLLASLVPGDTCAEFSGEDCLLLRRLLVELKSELKEEIANEGDKKWELTNGLL